MIKPAWISQNQMGVFHHPLHTFYLEQNHWHFPSYHNHSKFHCHNTRNLLCSLQYFYKLSPSMYYNGLLITSTKKLQQSAQNSPSQEIFIFTKIGWSSEDFVNYWHKKELKKQIHNQSTILQSIRALGLLTTSHLKIEGNLIPDISLTCKSKRFSVFSLSHWISRRPVYILHN